MNNNYWLKIEKFKFKNALECLNSYDKNKFKFSPWIEDIVKKIIMFLIKIYCQ